MVFIRYLWMESPWTILDIIRSITPNLNRLNLESIKGPVLWKEVHELLAIKSHWTEPSLQQKCSSSSEKLNIDDTDGLKKVKYHSVQQRKGSRFKCVWQGNHFSYQLIIRKKTAPKSVSFFSSSVKQHKCTSFKPVKTEDVIRNYSNSLRDIRKSSFMANLKSDWLRGLNLDLNRFDNQLAIT